jgi:5-methyltetrahydropteroyltriglutamate--homocysteine methyltransferase
VDAERIFPCTNCGMTPLPKDVATGKLWALGAGARLARKSL